MHKKTIILQLVFRKGFGWVVIGLVAGAALRAMIWGVDSFNVISLLGGTAAVAAAATLACWLPARRAARVDPIVAMRSD
ncbi:MAG: hypothetical protein ABSH26_15075 [Opitutaceae bacterium]